MHMTPEQAIRFESQFPDAAAYVRHCELENEYKYLRGNQDTLNDWQRDRLAELDALRNSISV